MKIYILGNGAMATAMALGLRDLYEVVVVGRDKEKLAKFAKFDIKTEVYGQIYDINNKNIILAFKPYALKTMSEKLSGMANNCISVLAMTKLDELNCIDAKNRICAIPNIAAEFKASITPYFTQDDDSVAKEVLDGFGKSVAVYSNDELKSAGVIAGCSPAYLAIVAEALANGGVKEGLKKEISLNLVSGVFASFSKLLEHSHPALLKERVCSPKGTTIEGVAVLEECGVRSAFIKALSASAKK
ncbi:pyrroline-5-carboxylate reductase [Campylobacter geochelonis]|uniref:pyrroline-5-carboxylate reductase n=1 Tax=Campylobacter geochelonis TaxID=1780362 RepID=UPI0007709846|nr:pyrroline-5-carboxylate reductase [Campylobacter geochelonis]CZE47613.1 pyrroline-5-carboxylate reductase [Campylobacter geochelonis]